MCRKVIQTYQQTFTNNVSNTNKQTFKFQRIYKTKPEQYFNLKLTTLLAPNPTTFTSYNTTSSKQPKATITPTYTDTTNPTKITSETMVFTQGEQSTQILSSSKMNEVFMSGINELNGRCNYMEHSSATSVIQKNDFYLGNLFDVGLRVPPEIILREIPLDPFTIYVNGNNSLFIVSFLIELLED